jgi:hypothetical protein
MAQCGGGPASRRAQQQQESVVESHFQGLLDDVMVGADDRYRALCGAFGYLQQPEWPDLSSVCYAGFGAPPGAAAAQETSNGGNSFSCSGSASSGGGDSRKRKPDAHADAKVNDLCVHAPVLVHCYCL